MGVEEQVRALVERALAELAEEGALPGEVVGASFVVERPKRPEHGDLATNAALAVQKRATWPRSWPTSSGARRGFVRSSSPVRAF
jgi:arginyl-tRNA synthetase